MFFLFGKNRPSKNSVSDILSRYTLYDQFTTARAAGSVNATNAEPVGGARTVTDTNSKISITGGLLDFATGAAANDGIWLPINTRVLGKTLLLNFTPANTTSVIQLGWDSDTVGAAINEHIRFGNIPDIQVSGNGFATTSVVGVYTATAYKIAAVLRAAGTFWFIKGGAFTNWTLLYPLLVGTGNVYPGMCVRTATSIFTADNIRVPKRLYIPVPLQSDGFSAATTDGAGNAEANGAVGNTYTNVGTWGVAAGVRSCSVLSGGVGFSYLPCTSSNVLLSAVCTRSGGVTGLVARYASATDHLVPYHDGTNAKLDKVVGGITTNLISAAATYAAGARFELILDGTTARLFYNNAAVGGAVTVPAAGSLNHGLYTTDVGATFDNLIIMARGNEGQYSGIDSL